MVLYFRNTLPRIQLFQLSRKLILSKPGYRNSSQKERAIFTPAKRGKLIKRAALLATLSVLSLVLVLCMSAWASASCNKDFTVGGGELGSTKRDGTPIGPPTSLGWDVGTGQCNGSFTVTKSVSIPSTDGGGIELAIRAHQRGRGPVTNTSNNGDYEIQKGSDPSTVSIPHPNGTRAWWNFQHSIAYDGNINELNSLTFIIRTDAGPSVPAGPFNMLELRKFIDDRNDTNNGQPVNRGASAKNPTFGFRDLYQTSLNPVLAPWFETFDYNSEGAWTLTLVAEKKGRFASVSVCVHTPNAACDPTPVFSTPDHFQCYEIDKQSKIASLPAVDLNDQFGYREKVSLQNKAEMYCTPVDKDGEGIIDLDSTFTCYNVDNSKNNHDLAIGNPFGEQEFSLKNSKLLCVPSRQFSALSSEIE
jgi:hypothetical protein